VSEYKLGVTATGQIILIGPSGDTVFDVVRELNRLLGRSRLGSFLYPMRWTPEVPAPADIRLQTGCGANIRDAAADAKSIATATGAVAIFEFNGIELKMPPNGDVDTVVRLYDTKMDALRRGHRDVVID